MSPDAPPWHLRIVDAMLPPELAEQPGPERSRGRTLVVTAFAAVLVGFASLATGLSAGDVTVTAAGLATIGGFALLPLALRLTSDTRAAATTLLVLGAAIATVSLPLLGGLGSAEVFWLPLLPAIALALLDYRAALGAAFFVAGLLAALYAAHAEGLLPPVRGPVSAFDVVRIGGMSLVVYLVVSWSRELALDTVRASQDESARARARLEAADRTRSSILASVSHELRTPMTGILGLSELLGETDLDARQRDWVRTIRQTGTALLTLLDDLLDTARLDSGNLTLKQRPFRPADLAEQVLQLFRPRAKARELTLHLEVAAGVPTKMHGDPARIRQVLINLVGNAIKFTSEGGVVLRVAYEAGAIVFDVTDTGPGIPPDRVGDIFEAFVRGAPEEEASSIGGVGLGLSIARMLVHAMDGEIEVHSEVGVGTSFVVRLPLETVDDDAPTTETPLLPSLQGKTLRVLVAEDNEVNRMVLTAMIESLGHQVHCVPNGEEVVPAAVAFTPDVVLMDMRMPVVDGLEATRRLRADPRFDPLRVLALTANAFEEDRQACFAAGMDGFLAKPVSRAQLKAALEFGGLAAEIGFHQRA